VDHHSLGNVRFDFDGALVLAQRLWALGSRIDDTVSARAAAAQTAEQEWHGAYATQFDDRINQSTSEGSQLAASASGLAKLFAEAWAHAATQQRWNDRATWIQNKENNKSAWDDATGWVFGDDIDKNTPNPPDVDVPGPPDFAATTNPHVPWDPS
jgi:hypothetical protein